MVKLHKHEARVVRAGGSGWQQLPQPRGRRGLHRFPRGSATPDPQPHTIARSYLQAAGGLGQVMRHICRRWDCSDQQDTSVTISPAMPPHHLAGTGAPRSGPLGPLDFNFAQHSPTRPSVKRTAEKAFVLSDRV